MELTKKQKVLSCVGHVKRKSMAKMVGCSDVYVSVILTGANVTTRAILGV